MIRGGKVKVGRVLKALSKSSKVAIDQGDRIFGRYSAGYRNNYIIRTEIGFVELFELVSGELDIVASVPKVEKA